MSQLIELHKKIIEKRAEGQKYSFLLKRKEDLDASFVKLQADMGQVEKELQKLGKGGLFSAFSGKKKAVEAETKRQQLENMKATQNVYLQEMQEIEDRLICVKENLETLAAYEEEYKVCLDKKRKSIELTDEAGKNRIIQIEKDILSIDGISATIDALLQQSDTIKTDISAIMKELVKAESASVASNFNGLFGDFVKAEKMDTAQKMTGELIKKLSEFKEQLAHFSDLELDSELKGIFQTENMLFNHMVTTETAVNVAEIERIRIAKSNMNRMEKELDDIRTVLFELQEKKMAERNQYIQKMEEFIVNYEILNSPKIC